MSVNVGGIDRVARFIIGIILVAFAIPVWFPATGWNWLGWFGLIPLLTALFGICPLYNVLGVSTCPAAKT